MFYAKKNSIIIFLLSLNILLVVFIAKHTLLSSANYHFSKNWLNTSRSSLFRILTPLKESTFFVGASIIQHCEWAELFDNNTIYNRGIAGDTTDDIILRMPTLLDHQPKNIFFMVGLNDLIKGRSMKHILSGYREILNLSERNTPKPSVFFLGLLPISERRNKELNVNDKIVHINKSLQFLCKEYQKCTYIDMHKHFSVNTNNLNEKLTIDGIHLNGEGYLLWKNILTQQKRYCTL